MTLATLFSPIQNRLQCEQSSRPPSPKCKKSSFRSVVGCRRWINRDCRRSRWRWGVCVPERAVEQGAKLGGWLGSVDHLAVDKHCGCAGYPEGLAFLDRSHYRFVALAFTQDCSLALSRPNFAASLIAMRSSAAILQTRFRVRGLAVGLGIISEIPHRYPGEVRGRLICLLSFCPSYISIPKSPCSSPIHRS